MRWNTTRGGTLAFPPIPEPLGLMKIIGIIINAWDLTQKKTKNRRIQQVSPLLWFIYWCSEWNKLIQGSIFGQKIHKKKGNTSILNNADAWGWVQSEDACHIGGCDKHLYSILPAGPSWLPSMLWVYYSTNPPLSSMNSPTDDSPANNSWEAHIQSVVKAVCTRMLSFRDATKQFNIPAATWHHLQLPERWQSPIHCSWIPATSQ